VLAGLLIWWGNTVKFTESGEIVAEVRKEAESNNCAIFHFSVRDTGIGIPLEKQRLIFDAFSQADSSTTRKWGCMGLELTSQLLAFACRQVLQPRRIDLNNLVEEGTSLLRRVIGEDIEVSLHPAANLRVTLADPVQIDQVLMNLCLNARDAMPKGGRLVIATQNVDIDEDYCRLHTYYIRPGSYVLLAVSDTGIGMDAATIDRSFEPFFFTTKEIGKGTGLGLATVFGIVKQHGGFINVYSEPGKGTTFRVYLPGDSGAPEPSKAEPDEQPQKGTETILLAEDHESLRELAQETLGALGYHLILASNGIEAVQLFKDNSDRIDLVVMDVLMPGMSGPDSYLKMSAIRPGLGVVFTTGYTAEAASLTSLAKKGASVLQKPYGAKGLSAE